METISTKPMSIKEATTALAATLSRIDGLLNILDNLHGRLVGGAQEVAQASPINPPGGSILDGITALENMIASRLDRLESALAELDRRI
jgi:hypothetical protein